MIKILPGKWAGEAGGRKGLGEGAVLFQPFFKCCQQCKQGIGLQKGWNETLGANQCYTLIWSSLGVCGCMTGMLQRSRVFREGH